MKHRLVLMIVGLVMLQGKAFAYVHPLDFDPKTQKHIVIKQIQKDTRNLICGFTESCTHSLLRMFEKKELDAFKLLTTAKNRKIMDNLFNLYCTRSECSYSLIWTMYQKEVSSSKKSLQW